MKAVAIGGGHGTAVTLRALRRLTSDVVAIVSVADNGGSTGRLRDELDVPAVGDLRQCLSALADPHNVLAPYLHYRFRAGDLEGHALGNLMLAGFVEETGDLETSVQSMGELLGITGHVIPASSEGVTLVARTDEGRTEGQVQVAASATIRHVETEPRSVRAPAAALEAIRAADLVVIGPGSLYTSVLAACVVPGITDALRESPATKVFVANLHAQNPETVGYTLADHLDAVARHGVTIDVVLAQTRGAVAFGDVHCPVVEADLAAANGRVHDAERLSRSLAQLVA